MALKGTIAKVGIFLECVVMAIRLASLVVTWLKVKEIEGIELAIGNVGQGLEARSSVVLRDKIAKDGITR